MKTVLTDKEINTITREAARNSAIVRDGSTSQRIARAIEAAVLKKFGEPVGWQWLDTGNFRKNLPKAAVISEWTPLYRLETEK